MTMAFMQTLQRGLKEENKIIKTHILERSTANAFSSWLLYRYTHAHRPRCTNTCAACFLISTEMSFDYLCHGGTSDDGTDTIHSRTVSHWRRRGMGRGDSGGEGVGEEKRSIARSHPGLTLSWALHQGLYIPCFILSWWQHHRPVLLCSSLIFFLLFETCAIINSLLL